MTTHDIPGSADANIVRYPYRRGAKVVDAEGAAVGTLEQIVVDRDSGILRGLVVRSPSGEREFELPEDRVSRNEGDTVHLSLRSDELEAHPEIVRPYNPQDYQPVEASETAAQEEASRIARQTGQPVVATVGDNAAEVVAPEASAPVTDIQGQGVAAEARADTLATPPTAAAAAAAAAPIDQKASDGAPDVTASGPELSDAPQAASAPEGAPPQTPSATESTTGELIGGKPSTGGMGAASVAPVQSYPEDDWPAPVDLPSDAERATDPGMIGALREAGSRPAFSDVGEPYLDTTAAGMEDERAASVGSPTAASAATAPGPRTAPATVPLARARRAASRLPSWATPGMLLTGGSIGAGVLAGIVVRRRQQQRPSTRARRAAGSAQRQMSDALQAAGEQAHSTASQVGESTAQARRQVAHGARRAARRGRWFRRGMLLGGALGILFAPARGQELRERLRDNASRRWGRQS